MAKTASVQAGWLFGQDRTTAGEQLHCDVGLKPAGDVRSLFFADVFREMDMVAEQLAAEAGGEGVQVDYLIVRAGELGVIISPSSNPSNTNLNCTLATKKMNELASKGWRYRDIIYTGETSGVLFERQR